MTTDLLYGMRPERACTPPRAQRLEDLRPAEPAPEGFAIAPHVLRRAREMPTPTWTDEDGKLRGHCPRCDQGLFDLAFVYNDDQRCGLLVAHMIQAHGWTRESCDD